MAQWLKHWLLFIGDTDCIPSAPTVAPSHLWFHFNSLFCFFGHLACAWCAYIHAGKCSLFKTKNKMCLQEHPEFLCWSSRVIRVGSERSKWKPPQGWPWIHLSKDVLPFKLGERSGTREVSCSRSPVPGLWDYSPQSIWETGKVRICSIWIFTDWWGESIFGNWWL